MEPAQLLQLSADPKDTVRDVLARVQCGEPAEQLALVHEGKELSTSQLSLIHISEPTRPY